MNMLKNNPRIILVGPLPPPYNGQNLAFGTAVRMAEDNHLPHVVIDIADRTNSRADGQFTLARTKEIVYSIVHFVRHVYIQNQIVYITNAQTLSGFVRDAVFIWLAAFYKHRIILHLHGGGYFNFYQSQPTFIRRLIVTTLCKADVLIVLSEHLREQYSFLPKSGPLITAIHNPPSDDINIRTEPVSMRSPDEPLRVLYLSNLIPSKGYMDVLEAIKLLHQQNISIHADFCGSFLKASDSPTEFDPIQAEEEFKTRIKVSNLSSVVTYHGIVKGEKKHRLLHNAHVFVLPTYYANEGQPISIIEAMANGLAIIATRYRGILDMVHDGKNGFFVSQQSPQEIAERLKQLYHDPALCAHMGESSLQHFCESFTIDAHYQSLLKAINPG